MAVVVKVKDHCLEGSTIRSRGRLMNVLGRQSRFPSSGKRGKETWTRIRCDDEAEYEEEENGEIARRYNRHNRTRQRRGVRVQRWRYMMPKQRPLCLQSVLVWGRA